MRRQPLPGLCKKDHATSEAGLQKKAPVTSSDTSTPDSLFTGTEEDSSCRHDKKNVFKNSKLLGALALRLADSPQLWLEASSCQLLMHTHLWAAASQQLLMCKEEPLKYLDAHGKTGLSPWEPPNRAILFKMETKNQLNVDFTVKRINIWVCNLVFKSLKKV